ncbi:hypothetical protein SRB5_25950 [Streptomyces sp. RB5]|uniref:FHA domain-containing protein n=1 Tax=Streptomyces smaragdinus TaxID=2585196 RepID=A0A7K0CG65_9ACTN|nr:FHA domain-containing protein [Streptomyces smaragdinus]MQY12461.1 hypothetical protein [Streptomyces smaragdinus]
MTPTTSLARDSGPAVPGTLRARTVNGRLEAPPRQGLTLRFGRGPTKDKPRDRTVDLGVGVDDLSVSRQHGELTFREGQWWLRNTGLRLIRLPRGLTMHLSTEPIPLGTGYTPVFVKGSGSREHLVELYVKGHDEDPMPCREAETICPLDPDERLLLVLLGRRYLRYEENPRPLTYTTAAAELARLRPDAEWTDRRIEHRVEVVRRRLQATGFARPLRPDRPGDDTPLHNLIRALVESTTLVPPDLELIDAGAAVARDRSRV